MLEERDVQSLVLELPGEDLTVSAPLFPVRCYPRERRPDEIPVHGGDKILADAFGTDRRAFSDIRAAAETLGIHLRHHAYDPLIFFHLTLGKQIEVRNFGRGKERGGCVGASGYASST